MYVNIMDTNSCKIHDLLSVKFQKKRFESIFFIITIYEYKL